jgi:hypothetical protein
MIMRKLTLVSLGLGLTCTVAPTQAHSASGPSAWVYVSSQIGTTTNSDVYGFTAASDGKLTLISTSPLATNLSSMAVNGLYLIGAPVSGSSIDSYHIESSGKLTYASTTDASTPNKCDNTPGPVFLDHTGQTLYDFYYWGDSICSNNVYQAWSIAKSSGAMMYISAAGGNENLTNVLTFIGNNEYAYTSDCYHFDAEISGFKRSSNGSLTEINLTQVWPKAPSGTGYCAYLAAADPTNHLAIPVQPYTSVPGSPSGPYQLATYTVNSSTGAISTSSTYANMPSVKVGNITALAMSPSGKLLAVAGTSGLQVFHFNGAGPITAYTGLMSTAEMDSIFWDNDNHLYAIGNSTNKLAVFTVTPTSWSWVDTYTVKNPIGLIVQPLPLPWD